MSTKLILEWVNLSDLARVKGIGEEYSDLLEEAGVDTVAELSQRMPETLYQKMVEINQAKKLVRKIPTQADVKSWVEQARSKELAGRKYGLSCFPRDTQRAEDSVCFDTKNDYQNAVRALSLINKAA